MKLRYILIIGLLLFTRSVESAPMNMEIEARLSLSNILTRTTHSNSLIKIVIHTGELHEIIAHKEDDIAKEEELPRPVKVELITEIHDSHRKALCEMIFRNIILYNKSYLLRDAPKYAFGHYVCLEMENARITIFNPDYSGSKSMMLISYGNNRHEFTIQKDPSNQFVISSAELIGIFMPKKVAPASFP
jgi:hypothetical protein